MNASSHPSSSGLIKFLGAFAILSKLAYGGPQIAIESNNGGEPQPVVNGDITPTESHLNFGDVAGNNTKRLNYKIRNTGNEILRIFLKDNAPSSSSSQFVLSGFPPADSSLFFNISPGQTHSFSITYSPTNQSTSSLIAIQSSDEDSEDKTFAFFVAGRGNLGDAEAFYIAGDGTERAISNGDTTPSFHEGTNFGNVLVDLPTNDNPSNQFAMKSLALSPSDATDQLILTSANITGADSGEFQLFNLGGNINQGSQSTFQIKFNPSSPGEKSATLTVTTNEPGQSPYTFDLRGTGTTRPDALFEGRTSTGTFGIIEDESTAISFNNGTAFGEAPVGGIRTNVFRITNNGDENLTLSAPGVGENFTLNGFPAGPITPGNNEEFTISFEPTSPGSHSSSFAVLTNIPGAPIFNFNIAGTGNGPSLDLQLQRIDGTYGAPLNKNALVTLGDVVGDGPDTSLTVVGEPTITGNFRITNTGNTNLSVPNSNVTSDTDASQYTIAGLPAGLTLAEGEFHDFTVSFDALTVGNHIGTVLLFNNAPSQPFTFRIRGNVIEGSEIAMSGRPDGGTLSPITSGATTTSHGNGTAFPPPQGAAPSVVSTFEFTNVGTNDLQYALDDLTGTHADDFLVDSPKSGTLTPGTRQSFTITFTPGDSSERTAQFNLVTTDPQRRRFTFALVGNVELPTEFPPAQITSFSITGADAEFQFTTRPEIIYRLKSSPNLTKNSWTNVPEVPVIVGNGTLQTLRLTDLINRKTPTLFYRIEEDSP